ncbi:hypothetical protein MBLNU230_g3021t1 [Neophaeotheca triangularis]
MASLLELSHELLHCIFLEIDPSDIAALRSTCHELHNYFDNNRLLFKELYGRCYDLPTPSPSPDTVEQEEWDLAIQNTVKVEKLLQSTSRDVKDAHLEFIAAEISRLVHEASSDPAESRNLSLLQQHFESELNRNSLLTASNLFTTAGGFEQKAAPTASSRQASAKLHCLYGVPIDGYEGLDALIGMASDPALSPANSTRSKGEVMAPHKVARGKVYNLREYTDASLWGPFKADGSVRVDWEKVEAVMVVLGFNLRKFNERSGGRFPMVWDEPFDGATPGSYVSPKVVDVDGEEEEGVDTIGGAGYECSRPEDFKIRELRASLDAQDPYGVSGTWMRIVCFLDYHDLFRYNFSVPRDDEGEGGDGEREPSLGPIGTEEAIRLIRIQLRVTKIVAPDSAEYLDHDDDSLEPSMDWTNFTQPRLPTVHFEGSSRSLHASWDPNANSRIRGTVRQTPENEFRWTTFSIFHGEERWRSEGIQVGGLKSARGVLGNWFDKDFSPQGPAGPTAFWKESDEVEEERRGAEVSWF